MNKRFTSIRYRYIRSHLYGLLLTAFVLIFDLLLVYALFNPDWLTLNGIFFFILFYVILAIVISFYVGFKSSSNLRERLDDLSVLIAQYANGNYQSRINIKEHDEIARISNEMNGLGEKLQSQVKSLQRMADEKAEFAKTAHKSAVIEERQRIARDLHDAVSQQLFALTMLSEAAIKQFDSNPDQAKEQMQDVVKAAMQSQAEMRALLLHLRPVHLAGDPLPKGIHKLVSELEQRCQLDFHVDVKETLTVSETIEEHVFRIIQEALANVLRHANATVVHLTCAKQADALFVHIRDNGIGFDAQTDTENKASYGLKTMQERCEELGGIFTIRTNKGEGTYIDIRIPC